MVADGLSYNWISAHVLHMCRLVQAIRSADVCMFQIQVWGINPTHQPLADTIFASTISGFTMSADNDSSISSLYRSCIQSFRRLLDAFETSGNVPPTFSDQIGRFRAWALSAGAHRFRESQMSLEHRLCEASKVRAVVVDLLVDLIRALRDGRYPSQVVVPNQMLISLSPLYNFRRGSPTL